MVVSRPLPVLCMLINFLNQLCAMLLRVLSQRPSSFFFFAKCCILNIMPGQKNLFFELCHPECDSTWVRIHSQTNISPKYFSWAKGTPKCLRKKRLWSSFSKAFYQRIPSMEHECMEEGSYLNGQDQNALYCTALQYTTLHYTTLHCTTRHCTTLYYTMLHYIALYCTVIHCTAEA